MKVKCISRSAKDLPSDVPLQRVWGGDVAGRSFPLIVGKEYVVYGVTITLGHVWYYIRDENFVYYPVWNPACLFEVSDSAVPTSWRVSFRKLRGPQQERFLLSFPEWVDDEYFYDKLTDGQEQQVRLFNSYRAFLNDEGP